MLGREIEPCYIRDIEDTDRLGDILREDAPTGSILPIAVRDVTTAREGIYRNDVYADWQAISICS